MNAITNLKNVPVGATVGAHWERANQNALKRAAEKLAAHGANPWVFSADGRHFAQFGRRQDYAALAALDQDEAKALLGHWDDEDWDEVPGAPNC